MPASRPSYLEHRIEDIRTWAAEGVLSEEIAQRLGCSGSLVRRLMRQHEIPRSLNVARTSKLDRHIEAIREWTAQGWRLARIATELGCSKQSVANVMEKHGIARHAQHSNPGALNPSWKGGRYLDDDGYVLIYAPDHPHADKAGRMREHRLVMETVLGRYLLPTEVVDHIDGNKSHNAPSNLRVFASNKEHLAATLIGRVPNWTPEAKERIRQGHRQRRDRQRDASRPGSETDDAASP